VLDHASDEQTSSRQSLAAKRLRQEGNSPDERIRSPSEHSVEQRQCAREDNEDVGLEAAIIERVRKSSFVEHACAEDVRASSVPPNSSMEERAKEPKGKRAKNE